MMTNKFIKKIMFISRKNIWNFVDWINILFREFMHFDWNLFLTIILNRDKKFIASFWQIVWKKMGIFLLIIATWHSQSDDQFEKTNQIIEIVFHYHFIKYFDDLRKWDFILSFIQIEHNNVKNFNIDYVSNEFITNFKIRDFSLYLFYDLSFKNFSRLRQIKWDKTNQTFSFNNIFAKLCYDKKHLHLKFNDYAYLKLHHDYKIFEKNFKKLSQQRIKFFQILKTFWNDFIIRLQFFKVMFIHSVVFIVQIEPASVSEKNSFHKKTMSSSSILLKNDAESEYKLKRVMNKRVNTKKKNV